MNRMMQKWGCAAAVAVVAAGCGRVDDAEDLAAREELRAQLARVERRVTECQAEIETMRREWTTDLRAVVQDMLRAELDNLIATTVQARVEAKLGDKAQVDRLVRETAMETILAHEAQKEAEANARREQERLEREQRRAQFEEERWNRLAQELKLNEQQKEQLRAVSQMIRQEFEAAMAQVRETGQPPDFAAVRQRAAELKAKVEASLAQFMTAEQIEAYRTQPFNALRMLDAMSGEGGEFRGFFMRRGERGDRDGDRRGPPGPPGR